MNIFIMDKDLNGTVVNRVCPSYFKERSFEFTAIRTNTKIIKYEEKKILAFVSFIYDKKMSATSANIFSISC